MRWRERKKKKEREREIGIRGDSEMERKKDRGVWGEVNKFLFL